MNDVLEDKCVSFLSKFLSTRVEKWLVASRPPQIWYNGHVFLHTHGISPFTNRTAFVSFCRRSPFQKFLPSVASRNRFHSVSLSLSWKNMGCGNIVKNNRRNIRSFKFSFFFFLATVEKSQFGLREKIFSSFSVILEGKKNDKKKKKKKGGRGWRRVVNRKDEKGGENMR